MLLQEREEANYLIKYISSSSQSNDFINFSSKDFRATYIHLQTNLSIGMKTDKLKVDLFIALIL